MSLLEYTLGIAQCLRLHNDIDLGSSDSGSQGRTRVACKTGKWSSDSTTDIELERDIERRAIDIMSKESLTPRGWLALCTQLYQTRP